MTRQTARHEYDRDIYTCDAAPGDVLIQITHPNSSVDGRNTELAIRDQTSGQMLIKVRLNAEQFVDLMSGTSAFASGAILPAHPERIGKRSQNVSTGLRYGDDRTPEQVRDAYLADGWEEVRIDRTNYGHRVVAYRWIVDGAAVTEAGE